MGTRIASGTKPSMLAGKVPGSDQQAESEKEMVTSIPKRAPQQAQTRAPSAEETINPAFMDAEMGIGVPEEQFMPEPTPTPAPTPEQPPSEEEGLDLSGIDPNLLNASVTITQKQEKSPRNYLFELQDSKEAFEGSIAGVKFKRDKDGEYYYYQTPSSVGTFAAAKTGEIPSKKEMEGGWRPVADMPGSTKNYLNIASSVMLDAPEIALGLAAGIGAGAVTGGMGFWPVLLTELGAGATSGYVGSTIAKEKYREMLKDKEQSKKLAFLEAALSGPQRPTEVPTATLMGAGGSLLAPAMTGMARGFVAASGAFASRLASLRPELGRVLDQVGEFANRIGVQVNAKDLVRTIDPNIETKVAALESGELGDAAQEQVAQQIKSNRVQLRGFLDAMQRRFAPTAEELAAEGGSVGRLTSQVADETPFAKPVMKPRADMNIVDVIEENHARTLKQNFIRGAELAGDLRFSADQVMAGVEQIFEKSFDSFRQLKQQGYSGAALLREFKLKNPKGAEEFARFYNNYKSMVARGPSALAAPADTQFVETIFDAIPAERFQSKTVQEQLHTIRHPIEPTPIGGAGPEYQVEGFPLFGEEGKFAGIPRPQYTDPTTGKTIYGRGDVPERAYYVTGGPAGQPGARMGMAPEPKYVPGEGMRAGTTPSGVSAELQPGTAQIQESLFGGPVKSAGGPRMVESPEKAFLPPTPGGEGSAGLTFRQLNELNNTAQQMVKNLESTGDTHLLGIAKELAQATRQFEDDALFKLGVVRGDEQFAEKVITDKAKYANAAKDIQEFRNIFSQNMNNIVGEILNLNPQMTERLVTYLSPAQLKEVRSLVLQRAYNDSISEAMKGSVHVKVNTEKLARDMLTQPENRQNIKLLFGEEALKELDSFATLSKLLNQKGDYKASEKSIIRAVSRIARTVTGTQITDYLNAFFKGNPTTERVIKTTLENSEQLLRKPEGGLLGKMSKAAYEIEKTKAGRMGVSAAGKVVPQTMRAMPTRYKTKEEIEKELSFGEMNQ